MLLISIIIVLAVAAAFTFVLSTTTSSPVHAQKDQKQNVTLRAMLDDLGLVGDWKDLLDHARDELSSRHPDMNIQINYMESQYNQTRNLLLTALANQAPIDLISLDQIWLGEFAQKGLLTDLTTRAQIWGRSSDW